LQDGDNILDFVKRNTPGYNPAASAIQQDVDRMAAERSEQVITAPETPDPTPAPDVVPDITKEDISEEQPPVEEPSEDQAEAAEEAPDEEDELKGSAAENFKKLRTKLKEVENDSGKKDKLLEEVTKELESYVKGEKIPEELKKREERLAELENYERILNLKKSTYYQDNFVKPIQQLGDKLDKIAKEYNIDPAQMQRAVNLKSEADLNRFLSNNFDTVGATEVKNIIREYQGVRAQAIEAEKEPEKAMTAMIESANAARAQAKIKRLQAMQSITKDSWKKSLDQIRDEGKIRELIYKEGDIEHNNKIFKPIIEAAASEYGKLVKELVANGLEDLPEPLAYALSRMCQLAHASAVAIDSRERAVSMAEELQTNTQRTNKYTRPSVSGKVGAGGSSKSGAGDPSSPMEAAERILQQVRGR
jgi:hypothetical protein